MLPDVLMHTPCSVELPAGCGKTETITRLVKEASESGIRCLVLTHTHAGVDAVRRRFKRYRVPNSAYTIRTLDSWCFDLIGHFPQLSEIIVGDEPDWTQSADYHLAGARATASSGVVRMLKTSYGLVIVDEYQDCQLWQHELVKQISSSVPVCVLGDRMQGLFFFSSGSPVVWERDVLPHFPDYPVEQIPWRWRDTNPDLGAWLLNVRESLMEGRPIDLRDGPLHLVREDAVTTAAWALPPHPSRSVVIKKWPSDCAQVALRLGGSFTMIEELEGRHLLAFAAQFDDPASLAFATAEFAVSCAFGVAQVFDSATRRRLAEGSPITAPRFSAYAEQVSALNLLLTSPSVEEVGNALRAIAAMDTFRLYRREAWFGVLDALRLCKATPELHPRDAVISTRNQLRVRGRYPESRIVARPLLIKGLEFDHAVVASLIGYNAHEVYVCLTRGSTSLTIAHNQPIITATRPGSATL